jgi:hypothetical protein
MNSNLFTETTYLISKIFLLKEIFNRLIILSSFIYLDLKIIYFEDKFNKNKLIFYENYIIHTFFKNI